jgi:enediyne biosynthesis thioesterase
MPETFVYPHLVPFEETNLVGNVYFAHYVRWQGHCRELFLSTHAPGVLDRLRDGLALVTVSCGVEFFAECWAADQVEVHMSLERIAGHRIEMGFDYYRRLSGGPQLAARGRQTVACMRRRGDRLEPIPVPDELREALRPYQSQDQARLARPGSLTRIAAV